MTSFARGVRLHPWSPRQWVKRADRDEGRGDGGLTTAEREELSRLRRENRRLKRGAGDPVKSRGLVRNGRGGSLEALFGFVKVNQATHPVGDHVSALQGSRSGY